MPRATSDAEELTCCPSSSNSVVFLRTTLGVDTTLPTPVGKTAMQMMVDEMTSSMPPTLSLARRTGALPDASESSVAC